MKTGILRKVLIAASSALMFTTFPGTPVHAEFVFKKDGSIIKGSIVKDYPGSISVKRADGVLEQVKRIDIMRINYTELYLGKVYARLTSGEVVEGYQVDEDRDNYFFRKDLTSPEEFKIQRKKVMFIAHTNPTDVKGDPSTVFINMSWSPPFKPAKFYRVYIRDVKNNEQAFKNSGETAESAYTLNNLTKSWTYELYATAIADSGEESLPSEKIIVNTRPEPPENLVLNEELSPDGRTVNLTFKWDDVTDPDSRVKGYNIYEIIDVEKVKKGTAEGGEFTIKDFPAEGKHRFSLVAVNDISAESAEVKTVYDAGYRIYVKGKAVYIYPLGTMRDMAASGYGGMVGSGIVWRKYSFGLETGIMVYEPAKYIKNMMMAPLLLEAGYEIQLPGLFSKQLTGTFSIKPFAKAGWSYDIIKYVVYNPSNPLIEGTKTKKSLDPMASAGACFNYEYDEKINIYAGAAYSAEFQKSGRLDFINVSFGACTVF
ncbi:MAG: hypothetical protein CVV49_11650 [Spirochaetae bacterium HGW-Spirochaetae-5]|nr:MAG: hypothetical protein CVV49_11650 [Spirochaetae bacterium HGW-Spirochaetae-5]